MKNFSVSCDYLVNKANKMSRVSYKERPISCGIMYNKNKLKNIGWYNPKFNTEKKN